MGTLSCEGIRDGRQDLDDAIDRARAWANEDKTKVAVIMGADHSYRTRYYSSPLEAGEHVMLIVSPNPVSTDEGNPR